MKFSVYGSNTRGRVMKKFALSLLIVLGLFSAEAQATGPYDGIWAMTYQGTVVGYVTVQENAGTVVAVWLANDNLSWVAYLGPRNGNTLDVSAILGGVTARVTGTFTSPSAFTGTQVFCVAAVDWNCLLPNGATILGARIW